MCRIEIEVEISVHVMLIAQGRSDSMASEGRHREGQEATYYNEALHEKINPNSYETQEKRYQIGIPK
jgi:hypothetical protein